MVENMKIRKIKGILCLVILMGLMFFIKARVYGSVSSGDVLDKPICFKICPSSVDSPGFMEDLYSSDIRIDLYHIGDIRYISERNSYELYNIEENVYKEVSKLNHVSIEEMNYTGSEWKAFSQEAISKVFEESVITPVKEVEFGSEICDINPGLYLMVIRGRKYNDPESYTKVSPERDMLTFVQSEEYEYTFEPNLIVIPLWSIKSDLQKNKKAGLQNSREENINVDAQNSEQEKINKGTQNAIEESIQEDKENDTLVGVKEKNYAVTESLEYRESGEVYEIYVKTSREPKEDTIGGSAGDSSDDSEGTSDNNKYSYGSGGSDDSYKSSGSGNSYRSDDSYKYGNSSDSIVKTGDNNNLFLYCILAFIFGFGSIIILVFAIYYKKRG